MGLFSVSRRRIIELVIFVLMLSGGHGSRIPEFEIMSATQSMENGKRKMQELSQKSNMPTDEGSCWKSALENLEVGCKVLTEEVQARMALRFTSCFNEMLGMAPYICEGTTPVKDCLKQLDGLSQSTFREYFLHTQDMCHYLRQDIWQEQTNNAVNRLTDAASDVTMQMVEQKFIQEQIYNSQQESLQVQTNMKKDNEDLYSAVVRVKDVFDDFSETAKEHHLISTEIFDKLSRMQKLVSWIQGEMSLFDMIFFYFAAIVFGYFATATTRTRAARFWLIILFMVAIWSEKALFKYLTQSDYVSHISPEDVQAFIWMVRKIAAGCGTLIVIIAAATYRDIQTVNNNILMNMSMAMEKIEQFIGSQSKGNGLPEGIQKETQDDDVADDEASDGDSFSNYSSDDSQDNLEHELKDLLADDENRENVQPGGFGPVRRVFGHATNNALSPARHRYNFRERSSQPRESPVVQTESVTEFARIIKKNQKPMEPRTNYFSSDDE